MGSSSIRISGSQKITFAIAILILQPPEKDFEGLFMSSSAKPIPLKIYIAFASTVAEPICSNLAEISDILRASAETSDLSKSFVSVF